MTGSNKLDHQKLVKFILLMFSIIVLAIFIRNIDYLTIKSSILSLSILNLMIVAALTMFMIFVKAIRWKLLIKKIDKTSITLWFSFVSVLGGIAASSIMPGRVDIAKPLMLKSHYHIRLSKSFSALTIERVLDVLGLLTVITIGIYFTSAQYLISYQVVFTFASIIIFGLISLAFFPRFFIKISKKFLKISPLPLAMKEKVGDFIMILFESFIVLKKKLFLLIISFLSLLTNFIEVIRFYFLFQLLNVDISFFAVSLVFASSLLIGVITSVPGGIGVTEYSAAEIVNNFISPSSIPIAKTIILIDRMLSYYLLVLLGSIVLLFFGKIFKKKTLPVN